MTVAGSGVGFFLIFFIYFVITLPMLILVAFFIKEFRQKLFIFSSLLSILFIPSLYKDVYFVVEKNIWESSQLLGIIWLFFSTILLIILLIYYVLRKDHFFKILWYSFISIVFMNVVATIYLFSK
ncbi:hypothetical protein [Acinetobacter haemolyticus]|jgi:hypothetical protein|uniref:Uncharacterized protein n=2 Tax=Acinetobacter haemolyticus TaxID=29430 RepID=A0A380UPE8_ACIHA|nr:hypothetical protein [Acinetobacter haemolyticus]EFF82604.1 hypothetical protein HMP0015_1931 [Acinetobacter haemolyticus ATCC 19194]ENW19939.1 hypothetical protein F926_02037 [Acinetobacter haemolyticus NIPH 261]QHI10179.1 hypothetical protein AhaeAN59_08735 [Acinetobacter haemolyticus]QHI13444.1 hypothetical protein AhaeAN43_08670 [Acinetobacter haemolyticus]QHI23084.1 hypothetical protein Ahae5227_09400 [Acinetobacter haemolyticus]